MTKRRKTQPAPIPSMSAIVKKHVPRVLILLTTASAGAGSIGAYGKGDRAEVKAAVVEERVNRLEADRADIVNKAEREQRQMQRIDRRLTTIEAQMNLTLDAMKVPQSKRPTREHGPEDSFE